MRTFIDTQNSVNTLIDLLPIGAEFTARQFDRMIKKRYPELRDKLDGTIMRRLRSCKNKYGARKVVCINATRSLYKKVHA